MPKPNKKLKSQKIKSPPSSLKGWQQIAEFLGLPTDAVREITSTSQTAWNYAKDDFKNRVVYLQEQNEAAGNIHPVRLLISEQKLTRQVTVGREKQEFVAEGPIASISTTTRNLLEIDDETRHLSLWMDQSPEQTKRIARRAFERYLVTDSFEEEPLTDEELTAWHHAYSLIKVRAARPVMLSPVFGEIADRVNADSIVARRYFPAFLEACRTIALIRSFFSVSEWEPPRIDVTFEDFCVASILFEDVFVESLHRDWDKTLETGRAVEAILARSEGRGVGVEALAKHLSISKDQAYRMLQKAEESGAIVRANKPEKEM
jgi:hypothetical protein